MITYSKMVLRYLMAGDVAYTERGQSLEDMFKKLIGRELLEDFARWADTVATSPLVQSQCCAGYPDTHETTCVFHPDNLRPASPVTTPSEKSVWVWEQKIGDEWYPYVDTNEGGMIHVRPSPKYIHQPEPHTPQFGVFRWSEYVRRERAS